MTTVRRILMVHCRYRHRGGEDESVSAEVAGLRRSGVDVDLLEVSPVPKSLAGTARAAAGLIWSRRMAETLIERLERSNAQLLHIQNHFPAVGPAVYGEFQRRRIPVVHTLRNYRVVCANGSLFRDGATCRDCVGTRLGWPGIVHRCYRRSVIGSLLAAIYGRQSLREGLRHGVRWICLSQAAAAEVEGFGVPRERISIKPTTLAYDPGPGPGGGGIIFVGRLAEEKGISTLLAALAGSPDLHCTLVGSGPLLKDAQSFATSHRNLVVTGALAHGQVLELLQRAAITVVPSIWPEPFGRVAIESLACGTPVVASATGGLSEIISTPSAGTLVPPGDARSLELALRRALATATPNQRLLARGEYDRRYSIASVTTSLREIYNGLLTQTQTTNDPPPSTPPPGRR